MIILRVYQRRPRGESDNSLIKVYQRRHKRLSNTVDKNELKKQCSWVPTTPAKPSPICHAALNSEEKEHDEVPVSSRSLPGEAEVVCNISKEDFNKLGVDGDCLDADLSNGQATDRRMEDKQICGGALPKDLDSMGFLELNGGIGYTEMELEKDSFTDGVETLDSKHPANSTTQTTHGAINCKLERTDVPVGSDSHYDSEKMKSIVSQNAQQSAVKDLIGLRSLNGSTNDEEPKLVKVIFTDCTGTLDSKGPTYSTVQVATETNHDSDAMEFCSQQNAPEDQASLIRVQDAVKEPQNKELERKRPSKFRYRPSVVVERKHRKAPEPRTPKLVTPRHPISREELSSRKRKYVSESCENPSKTCRRELHFDKAHESRDECMITRSTHRRKVQEDLCLHISKQCGPSFPMICKKLRKRRRQRLNMFFMDKLCFVQIKPLTKRKRSRRLPRKGNLNFSAVTSKCNQLLENPLIKNLSCKMEEAKFITKLDLRTNILFNDNHKNRLTESWSEMEPSIVSKYCDDKREGGMMEKEDLSLPSDLTDSVEVSQQEKNDCAATHKRMPAHDDLPITPERDGPQNMMKDFISRVIVPDLKKWAENIDGRPQHKPKKKKHRPKVAVEGKWKKTPQPKTPKPKTPKCANSKEKFKGNCVSEGFINGRPPKKRKYERKSSKIFSVPLNKIGAKTTRRLDFDLANQPEDGGSQETFQEERIHSFIPENSLKADHLSFTALSNGFRNSQKETSNPVSLQSLLKPKEFWFSLESRGPQEGLQGSKIDSFIQKKPLKLEELGPMAESREKLLQEEGNEFAIQGILVKYEDFQATPKPRCTQLLKETRAERRERMKINFIVKLFRRLQVSDAFSKPVKENFNEHGMSSGYGTIVPYQGSSKPIKMKPLTAKVDLDPETLRVWNLLMHIEDGKARAEEADPEKENWMRRERDISEGRAESFNARMHLVLGDRRFTAWKGSVVDSVVGVFLTQNVSDNLSSSAYMSLAARFPLKSTIDTGWNGYMPNNQEETETSTGGVYDVEGNMYFVTDPEPDGNYEQENEIMPYDSEDEEEYLTENEDSRVKKDAVKSLVVEDYCTAETINEIPLSPTFNSKVDITPTSKTSRCEANASEDAYVDIPNTNLLQDLCNEEHLKDGHKTSTKRDYENPASNSETKNVEADDVFVSLSESHDCFEPFVSKSIQDDSRSCMQQGQASAMSWEMPKEGPKFEEKKANMQGEEMKRSPNKNSEKNKVLIDWESKRRMYSSSEPRSSDHMDSVDWEAVRCADVDEIAKAIKDRGQQNQIAARIKNFLNQLVEQHGSIDLEWLRNAPPAEVKDYLLEIPGLGLKSVECVRLLCLQHVAFPVDTNVGRIAVRLGWVPLQPLPENLQIHLLDQYPLMDNIQKYLWPRLCHLDQRILYELHYQMITFGKVFCKKRNPNCGACPLRGECKHFASAFASAKLALPGPSEKGIVPLKVPNLPEGTAHVVINPIPVSLLGLGPHSQSAYETNNFVPIIEEPPSPQPQECPDSPVPDLEDFCADEAEDIPIIRLQEADFQRNLQNFIETNNIMLQDSRALVSLTAEAASYSVPKLKNVSRLRTEHLVYVLPDNHDILQGFEKRDPDDPCPYLLVIWTPGETSNSYEVPKTKCTSEDGKLCNDQTCYLCNRIREQDADIVRGSVLIPCRTANRGRFPLNGTYFQVNEVFADHETSLKPIHVPRNKLANLPTRTAYFGTSTTSVLNALDIGEIQKCFWRGFICVRGFDRKYRAPRPLSIRLHCSPSRMGKPNEKLSDE